MPLLKRKVFVTSKVPEFLRDDEEVFHCEVTNEIFRDYEKFCERMILVNSMVWSCSMTGRGDLTYAEALESEENARKNLRDFPTQLRVPLLYLASKTSRQTFTNMADDIFQFVKDRYFVHEIVEADINDNWQDVQILQVMAPAKTSPPKTAKYDPLDPYFPKSASYRYEVEKISDDNQIFIVEATNIRRKKSQYSRDKNKLFLRQFLEANSSDGIWRVKDPIYQKYHIKQVTFDQIFDGPLPDFSKKLSASSVKKQASMMKYLNKKENGETKKPPMQITNANKKNLLEAMKQRQEEMKQRAELAKIKAAEDKVRKNEQKRMKRAEEREKNNRDANIMRDWHMLKEDLELEDHKALPIPTPVESKIPSQFFADAIMVLDFVNTFYDTLNAKKSMSHLMHLEYLERALFNSEINGPLTALIKVFLTAIFQMMEDEESDMKAELKEKKSKERNLPDFCSKDPAIIEAKKLATAAIKLCSSKHGITFSDMPIDGLTITEVLRLHLLSSGAENRDQLERYRYHQRGGYYSEDDPGLLFCINHPNILRELATKHVTELPPEDKLRILVCLTLQAGTYTDIRDVIEDRLEKMRVAKHNLKTAQQNLNLLQRKNDSQLATTQNQIKKDYKILIDQASVPVTKVKLQNEMERKLTAAQKTQEDKQEDLIIQMGQYQKQLMIKNTKVNYLGSDRAYRRYYFIQSLPALLVEQDDPYESTCLIRSPLPIPALIDADQPEILKYFQSNQTKHVNGITKNDIEVLKKLNLCTATSDCPVHSAPKQKWFFFHKPEDIEKIINSLNKRGYRESELRGALEMNKEYFEKEIEQCPLEKLSSEITEPAHVSGTGIRKYWRTYKDRYTNSNFGMDAMELSEIMEVTLRDYILELEEQISAGGLGVLPVADRKLWRKELQSRNYDLKRLKYVAANGLLEKINNYENSDDGKTNGSTNGTYDIKEDNKSVVELVKDPLLLDTTTDNKAIIGLATALEVVALGIYEKFLDSPLGHPSDNRKRKRRIQTRDYLPQWRKALLQCTSLSQLFLHYSTLETSVDLSRSALNARCFKCRASKNDDQLLICDGCNRGQHLYCVEPKLNKVPAGDWFCEACVPPEPALTKERIRKRRVFSEASDDEQTESPNDTQNETIKSKDSESEHSDFNPDETVEDDPDESVLEVCSACGSGGLVVCCNKCPKMYHPECVEPPLKRIPRGDWFCEDCKQPEKKVRRGKRAKHSRLQNLMKYKRSDAKKLNHADGGSRKRNNNAANGDSSATSIGSSDEDVSLSRARRCARQARNKIHGFARSLRRPSLDFNSDEDEVPLKKKARRGSRKVEISDDDLPLHNAPLQELLAAVLRHPDAWAFTQPVQKRDVPDYFDVISHPMDFGTIKYKLNMGKYQYDAEVMADAMLVFENCNTYNDSEADVYKCGVKLLKFFKKRAMELGFRVPKTITGMDEDAEDIIEEEHAPEEAKTSRLVLSDSEDEIMQEEEDVEEEECQEEDSEDDPLM